MYILKNAWKSISRSKGRNILIGIIVVVIAMSSCIALSIQRAADKAKTSGLDSLQITAQISVNRQAMMEKAKNSTDTTSGGRSQMLEAMQGMEELSLEELQKYAQSSYLEGFTYTLQSSMDASGELEAVDTTGGSSEDTSSGTSSESASGQNGWQGFPGGMGGGQDGGKLSPPGGMGSQGDFTVTGYSSHEAMTSFVDGTSKITDGTVFDEDTSEKVCIISEELATLNELEVGDSITLANPNDEDETFAFKVVGIYETTSTDSGQGGGMMRFSTASDPANQIYMSYNTLKAVTDQSEKNADSETDSETGMVRTTALRSQVSGTYILKDLESYEAFEQDVRDMGLSEEYTVSSSDVTAYEQSLLPLENLSKFSSYFFVIVLAIGAVILVVFNIFNIRERKYEVGVLTAIGMKKGKVALQFVLELFIVTFIAILVGTAAGAVSSAPIANQLLSSQVSSQQNQTQQRNENFGIPDDVGQGGGAPQAPGGDFGDFSEGGFGSLFGAQVTNYVSEINASTDFTVVMELMGIGVLLTLLSSCAAVVFILRYEPLKILSNRS